MERSGIDRAEVDVHFFFCKGDKRAGGPSVAVRGGFQLRLNAPMDAVTLFAIDVILRRGGAGRVSARSPRDELDVKMAFSEVPRGGVLL